MGWEPDRYETLTWKVPYVLGMGLAGFQSRGGDDALDVYGTGLDFLEVLRCYRRAMDGYEFVDLVPEIWTRSMVP